MSSSSASPAPAGNSAGASSHIECSVDSIIDELFSDDGASVPSSREESTVNAGDLQSLNVELLLRISQVEGQKKALFREVKSLRSQIEYLRSQLAARKSSVDSRVNSQPTTPRCDEDLEPLLVQAQVDRLRALEWAEREEELIRAIQANSAEAKFVNEEVLEQNAFLRKEIKFLRAQWTGLRNHVTRTREKLDQFEAVSSKMTEFSEHNAGLRKEVDAAVEGERSAQEAASQLRAELAATRQTVSSVELECVRSREELERLRVENQSLSHVAEELKASTLSTSKQVTHLQLECSLRAQERDKLQADLSALLQDKQRLAKDVERKENDLRNFLGDQQLARKTIAELQQHSQSLQRAKELAETNIKKLSRQYEELQADSEQALLSSNIAQCKWQEADRRAQADIKRLEEQCAELQHFKSTHVCTVSAAFTNDQNGVTDDATLRQQLLAAQSEIQRLQKEKEKATRQAQEDKAFLLGELTEARELLSQAEAEKASSLKGTLASWMNRGS
eukprot:gnl/Hemi2/25089_TR8445_c0_g1_i1.p1 gnl/Hemi2/25089_TR8445_c0_g1~~gnl/Hemi2/25089_TR8445_c0_g1_i1.p1  ORF type:complete len:506 (+),score=69.90 gnl/Hemi2/25089_TR8445_c0_g1_i1:81-1598(+)